MHRFFSMWGGLRISDHQRKPDIHIRDILKSLVFPSWQQLTEFRSILSMTERAFHRCPNPYRTPHKAVHLMMLSTGILVLIHTWLRCCGLGWWAASHRAQPKQITTSLVETHWTRLFTECRAQMNPRRIALKPDASVNGIVTCTTLCFIIGHDTTKWMDHGFACQGSLGPSWFH